MRFFLVRNKNQNLKIRLFLYANIFSLQESFIASVIMLSPACYLLCCQAQQSPSGMRIIHSLFYLDFRFLYQYMYST